MHQELNNTIWSDKHNNKKYVLLYVGQDAQTLEDLVIYKEDEEGVVHVTPYIRFLRKFEKVESK